jgi:hypothetical protein
MINSENTRGRCADCAHFRNDPAFLEEAFGGLIALSSAHGSVRADDGICVLRERYLSARASCPEFQRMPRTSGCDAAGRHHLKLSSNPITSD